MKVRVEISGQTSQPLRVLNLQAVPMVGETIETDFCGSCQVAQVIHTPEAQDHEIILVLKRHNA